MLFLEKLEQKKFYIVLVLIICIIIGILYTICFGEQKFVTEASLVCLKTEKDSNNKIQTNGSIELTDNMLSTFEEIAKSTLTIKEVKKVTDIDIESQDISLKKISNSDTFKIKIKSENYDKIIEFSNEFIEVFSKKAEIMLSNAEIYVVDSPNIENTTYGNLFIISIGISILIGVLIILIYIVFLMKFDKKIKNVTEIESELSLRNLTTIPLNKRKSDLVFDEKSNSISSKAFKILRANIQFVNVNYNRKNTILITSPKNDEGKSYVSANLAISFAEAGKKVMLIDADMNTGRQGKIFNIPNNLGLSNYLSNLDSNGIEINELVNKFINETEFKNLNIITSGTIPPNSSELLASPKLVELIKDLTVFYDVLIIDSGKILEATDALILTRLVNSTILVSSYNKTNKDDLWQAKKDIQNVGGRIIGNILNKTKEKIVKEKEVKPKEKNIIKSRNVFETIKEKLKKIIIKFKNYISNIKMKYSQKLLVEGTKNEVVENTNNIGNNISYISSITETNLNKESNNNYEKLNYEGNNSLNNLENNREIEFNNIPTTLENNEESKKVKDSNINVLGIIQNYNENIKEINNSNEVKENNNKSLEKVNINVDYKAGEEENTVLKESSVDLIDNVDNNEYPETEVKVIYKNRPEHEITNNIKEEVSEITNNKLESIKQKTKNIFNNVKNNINKILRKIQTEIISSVDIIKKHDKNIAEDEVKYVAEENEEKVIETKKIQKDVSNEEYVIKPEENKTETVKEDKIETINDDKKQSQTEEKNENGKTVIDDIKEDDETILVIVDADNGYCRAFNKYCFTEKAVRGIDPIDGFSKAHYSSYLLKKRIEDLMNLYGITENQAKRVDTLIYSTLLDYDDEVWIERKMTSNKADVYAKCMAKNYDMIPGENKEDYERRCQNLRKLELKAGSIEIEYVLDGLWKSKSINFTDKIVMNKFAGIYDSSIKLKLFTNNKKIKNKENSNSNKIKKNFKNINIKENIFNNLNKLKEKISNIKVEQVKAKSVEEIQKEVLENCKQNQNENFDNMSVEEYYNEINNEKIEEIDYKKVEEEIKRELEFFKEQKREEKMIQKRIAKEERKAKKIEKMKKREEARKNKELEKQKQRQEAKIEEELLVDNLYPKTKNNKDI